MMHRIRHLFIRVMAQIFKSGDLSNLIRSFDSISGGFLSTVLETASGPVAKCA